MIFFHNQLLIEFQPGVYQGLVITLAGVNTKTNNQKK
jgi:hypothetical protein